MSNSILMTFLFLPFMLASFTQWCITYIYIKENKPMRVSEQKLHKLIADKMHAAGLSREHADVAADVLVWADFYHWP